MYITEVLAGMIYRLFYRLFQIYKSCLLGGHVEDETCAFTSFSPLIRQHLCIFLFFVNPVNNLYLICTYFVLNFDLILTKKLIKN